jgi:hypothetical protein
MPVIGKFFLQSTYNRFCGTLRAEEHGSHVIIDADNFPLVGA